jgi:hypothetical protein
MADQSDFLGPLAATGSQGMLREALVSRVPYVIADTENPADLTALDAGTGGLPWALVYEGRVFALDPADATTAHDGLTTIVTDDGYRYKVETVAGSVLSVLSKETTAPPTSPGIGDAYLVLAGATGDWASHPDELTIWTARGWRYVVPAIGMLVFVEDEAGYYHFDAAGDWTSGIGSSVLAPNSVRASQWMGGRTHWVIVNQTTNTPPVSPATGVAYIVGPSPTGDWAGQTGKVAVWEGAAWTFYSPLEGWVAYDQAMNVSYVFNGAWNSQQSGYSSVRIITTTGTASLSGAGSGGGTNPTATTPPVSNGPRVVETIGTPIDIQADYAGQRFEITYAIHSGNISTTVSSSNASTFNVALGVFIDSETQARDWYNIGSISTSGTAGGNVTLSNGQAYTFSFTLADTSVHQLRPIFAIGRQGGSADVVTPSGSLSRRKIIIRKLA